MRRPRTLLVLLAAVTLGGCVESTAIVTTGGAYTLQTVDGEELPFRVRQDASGRIDLASGDLLLLSDFTFQQRLTYEIVQGLGPGTRTDVVKGTWEQTGGGVNLYATSPTSKQYTMGLSGRTLTQIDSPDGWPPAPHTFVYSK